ncbi:SCP2 sterol-binding domain-containing protein [Alisedimentitalea sp. MJ-SS2]|uniref:SCP2 sterol-binding domain-containing protein n=1 Tax=Aliisedimentitalea sp. MJ-SS2 TaxID=3049795 RepID=UPI0029101644|nr:SCP2 sterol-binding domain-containing protein [Alisedimentitalea sp. MJ-SS2]MDU8927902.1 SCP2 sterol-binding domain-containing protein [Alisedimentitalea sp. MJ-SS2]
MSLAAIADGINANMPKSGFEWSLKFDCGDDGVIVLADGVASTEDRDTDCTIKLTTENLTKLLLGKLNPMTSVMTGKLKVSGNAGVAMKLGSLLKG